MQLNYDYNDVLRFQVMEKGYKRLTPEQPVGLRHAGCVISVQKVIKVRLLMLKSLFLTRFDRSGEKNVGHRRMWKYVKLAKASIG